MDNIKLYLNQLFSKKELSTLKPISNFCSNCENTCGSLIQLNECTNNKIICLNCLDNYYDSFHSKDYLFDCPCCNKKITDYIIIKS